MYFRHGHADRAVSSKGTGSRLFVLNVHMWQYGAATATYHIRRRASCKTGKEETSRWSKTRASERPSAGQKCAYTTGYCASCTMTCEVISFSHLRSITIFCPPSTHTPVTPTHSRLHCRAGTGGGSVSGLLPSGRRHRGGPSAQQQFEQKKYLLHMKHLHESPL